ncbi:putative LRR receptor-like serine/threonine-protein kinaseisoform X1 [Salvia divinorum]|uniref:LRR receptor-like serine/threonine-protein kinaseisoform X1 n=1 Tax=Salvia divinorum TaxID=28513 RepID=A0ABD1HNQ1_SALDI
MASRWFIISLVLSLCTSLSISADVLSALTVDHRPRTETKVGSLGYRVADTLRVFTTRNKNCYHIDSVKKGRVLVRASFYYGNYDGKSLPPKFDLHFDGNFWTTVQTSNTEFYYYEVTCVLKKESISVCLAQTEPSQFPFISALEVRSLESSMYDYVNDSYPLLVWKRVAFGSKTVFRYQDDPYDRLWNVGGYGNGSIPVSGDAIFTKRPQLGPSQNRSFRIFKDNESYSEPIRPLYGNCVEMILDSAIAVSSNTTFSLVPTNVSTLPPLINALEIFRIPDDKLTDGTNKKDVEGLAALQERFSLLQSWAGDPCLPAPYTWDWIKCSLAPIPRVTELLLNGFGLSGSLPDFSSMDALQTIDVQNNSLGGPIPDFLGTFPNLKILNLANNQFNGSVPASMTAKKGLVLTVSGNPGLCTSNVTCHIPQANSSTNNNKMKNILELLFAAVIASIVIL